MTLLTGTATAAGSNDVYYRQQALKFLHVCLASVLNLRPLGKGELDSSVAKMMEMLLGHKQPPPQVLPEVSRVELGVKTKTQLVAERQVLVMLVSSIIGENH